VGELKLNCDVALFLRQLFKKLDLSSMICIFFAPDELDAALHEDVVEAEDEPHQHEHLDHLDGGRHLQAVRYAQEPEKLSAI
jgi:hypothetical protein